MTLDDALQSIRQGARIKYALAQATRRADLVLPAYFILRRLSQEDLVQLIEIRAGTPLPRTNAVRLLNSLEEERRVAQVDSSTNRKEKYYRITKEGRAVLKRAHSEVKAELKALSHDLTGLELELLRRVSTGDVDRIDIQRELGIFSGRQSETSALEERGLLRTYSGGKRNRTTIVSITDAGLKKLREIDSA